jgi:hypothetical protein
MATGGGREGVCPGGIEMPPVARRAHRWRRFTPTFGPKATWLAVVRAPGLGGGVTASVPSSPLAPTARGEDQAGKGIEIQVYAKRKNLPPSASHNR